MINDEWVLTAGHCLNEPTAIEKPWVYLADHRMDKKEPNQIVIEAAETFIHPNFFVLSDDGSSINTDFQYDIGLIKLSKPVKFNEYIRPLCLDDFDCSVHIPPGTLCTIAGWGQSESHKYSMMLHKANIPTVENHICQQAHHNYYGIFGYVEKMLAISDNQICAGFDSGGIDTCQGDSGGPLICKNETTGRYFLHGIVRNFLYFCSFHFCLYFVF